MNQVCTSTAAWIAKTTPKQAQKKSLRLFRISTTSSVHTLLDLHIASVKMAATCIAPSTMFARTTQRSFMGSKISGPKISAPTNGVRVSAKLGSWSPGSETPAYLENAVGSYGFDPLSLAKEPAALQRYTEAELIHCRWAMVGVAGCLGVELFGQGSWFDAPLWVRFGGGRYCKMMHACGARLFTPSSPLLGCQRWHCNLLWRARAL